MQIISVKKVEKKKVSLNMPLILVSKVELTLSGHFGPISDLDRSPFFSDIILSVGGWSFNIWKEKVNVRI